MPFFINIKGFKGEPHESVAHECTMKKTSNSSGKKDHPDARAKELQFLANASLRINQLETSDEVAAFVCEQIKILIGIGYVAVTLLDDATQTLGVRAFKGLEDDNLINSGLRLIGSDPRRLKVPIVDFTADDLAIYNTGRLEFLPDGLYTIMVRKYPKAICNIIERLFNIRFVYTMGFVFHGRHIGGIGILADAESAVEPNRLIIENIVAQAAAILTRIRTENTLQESNEKYRILLEDSPDPIFSFTPEGMYTYANQALADVFGKPVNDIVGKTLWDFFPKAEADKRFAAVEDALRTGKEGTVEGPIAVKDGIRYYMTTISPIMDNQGKPLSTMCSSKNITERKQAEDLLLKTNNLLKESELIGKAGGWELHIDTGEQQWTEETGRIHEVEPDFNPNIEKGLSFYTPASRPVISQAVQQVIATGESFDLELEIITAKGNLRKVRAVGHPDLEHRRVYGFFQDITDQKKAEEQLRQSEEKFRLLTENSLFGVYIILDGKMAYVNASFANIFDYKPAEIIGILGPQDLIYHDDIPAITENVQEWLAGQKETSPTVYRGIKKDGSIIFIEVFGTSIEYQGKTAVMGTLADVTERNQAEEALRESREQYRTLIDNANEAIVVAQDGELKYVNRTSLEIFSGYTEQDLLNKKFTDFIHPDDRARIMENFLKRLRNQPMSARNEYRVMLPDGAIKWAEIGTTVIQWKDKPATLNFISDITDRKKAEDDLLESQAQQKAIVDSTTDMIWSVEPEKFKLLTFNRGFSDFFLQKRGIIAYKGMTPEALFPNEEYIRAWLGFYQRTLVEGSFSVEFVPYATKTTMQLTLNALKRDNRIFGISVFGKDVTELKKVEEEKKLMEEKAQVANRLTAVGEMAAGIAHEINNPLTSVIGFSKLVLEDETISTEMKEDLMVVAESSQRIANIVKGLLTFARQSKPLKTSINLNELIDNTLKLREYVLKTNKIEVVTKYDRQLPWVVVDPAQMQQVFLNLIVNAEQAMKKAHGRGILTIITEKKGNVISIAFQDDGPGITKENMGRLFEPFFTTKDPGEGTGLGLSISRSIILEHNGKMMVESKEGYGATFTIEIPAIENPAGISEPKTPVPEVKSPMTKKGRILVVDDEPGVRALLDSRLTKMGHSVDTISDGASAMEMINAGTNYDLIIADVRMPGMNGIELYTLIKRKMPSMANNFIFITGDVMGADIKAFIHQNRLAAYSKPFDTAVLLDKINSMLGEEKPQSLVADSTL